MTNRFKSPSGSYGLITRYPCEIQVKIPKSPEGQYQTAQVSREGVFVLTEQPLPVNQLITAYFILPPLDHLQTLCHVKYAVTKFQATQQTPAGMELAIFSMDKEEREKWDQFVDKLEEEQTHKSENGAQSGSADFRRSKTGAGMAASGSSALSSSQRILAQPAVPSRVTLEVMPPSVKKLIRLINEEILGGSLVVATDQVVCDGSEVELRVVHPITGGVCTISGKVSHCQEEEDGQSAILTVRFTELDHDSRRTLIRFGITGQV
ncbi:MAG: hypothetical protein JW797_07575 [Bradymonadales bacterium]|nr:hypothetical protein [Bradymonadales bacterium]